MSSTETAVAAAIVPTHETELQKLEDAWKRFTTWLTGAQVVAKQVSATVDAATPGLVADAQLIETVTGNVGLVPLTGAAGLAEKATNAVVQADSVNAAATTVGAAIVQLRQTVAVAAGTPAAAPAPTAP